MTVFWAVAAALLLIAMLLVVLPVLRQRSDVSEDPLREVYRDRLREIERDRAEGLLDEKRLNEARDELSEQLLIEHAAVVAAASPTSSRGRGQWLNIVAALLIPLVAVATYGLVGNPTAINPPAQAKRDVSPSQVEALLGKLALHLEKNPTDLKGWSLLARSWSRFGRYAEANKAFASAVVLAPDDAQLWADYAENAALAAGQSFKGQPRELVTRALKLDPANQKALSLAGVAEFESGHYTQAVTYWEKLLRLLPANAPQAEAVRMALQRAQEASAGPTDTTQAASTPPRTSSASNSALSGTVRVASELANKANPNDTVFVFARAASGPRMPLAIQRVRFKDLPLRYKLDDSMAMAPNLKISAFPQVVVVARISRTGNAVAQAGDLEGSSKPVKPGAGDIDVRIDSVHP